MRLLTASDVGRLLEPTALVGQVEEALVALSSGRASTPPRVAVRSEEAGEVLLMGCHVAGSPLVIVKLVGVFMANAGLGLLTHQSTICGFDAQTGELRAVMDAAPITALRTAAVSALSIRLLGHPGASVAIVGTGEQALAHALVISSALGLSDIVVVGRDERKTISFAERCAKAGIAVVAAATSEGAIAGADVVVTATHSPEPVLQRSWLRPGAHIVSVGVNSEGQEIDDDTVADALVVVESLQTAIEPPPLGSNEVARAVRSGKLATTDIVELGAIAAGWNPGRTRADQITLFKSVGSAAADAAVANAVFARALKDDRGVDYEMNPKWHTELHA
jgi:alanine dehydrogenase